MPVIVPCPKCGVKLSAPESAAGKRIRCTVPGCAAITVVPDFIKAEVLEVVDAILSPPGPSDEALPEQSVDKDRPSAARETDRRRGGGRNRRREPDLDDDRPRAGRRKKAQKGKSAVAIAGCGFVFLAAAALGIYLITFKSASATRETRSDAPADAGNDWRTKRPKGARLGNNGLFRESSEVVDEAWSQLRGRWEMLPNPRVSGNLDFGNDYTFSSFYHPTGGQPQRVKKVVAVIADRSIFSPHTTYAWLTGHPNNRLYQLGYECPPGVSESGSVSTFANGTISEGGGEERYYRVAGTGPAGERVPPLEETLWVLLAGRRWAGEDFNWTEVVEFRTDKTLYWTRLLDRKDLTTVEGKITAIQPTRTGFNVLLGAHTVNGRSQASGAPGEFYYLGKYLHVRRNGADTYSQLTPKAME